MSSLNKVLLLGNLTRDPELRYAPNGTAVARFGLAVNTPRGGQGDDRKDEVCFVDIIAFGRQAETASEYLSKGRPALVEGRLQWRSWEGQDGQKRSKHEVIAERIQFLGRGGEEPMQAAPPARQAPGTVAPQAPPPPRHQPADAERVQDDLPPLDDDDIPF
jgi:single-strand DNA-binding protein